MFEGAKVTLVMLLIGFSAQPFQDGSCVSQARCYHWVKKTSIRGQCVNRAGAHLDNDDRIGDWVCLTWIKRASRHASHFPIDVVKGRMTRR